MCLRAIGYSTCCAVVTAVHACKLAVCLQRLVDRDASAHQLLRAACAALAGKGGQAAIAAALQHDISSVEEGWLDPYGQYLLHGSVSTE
jgi:hypothetical protein